MKELVVTAVVCVAIAEATLCLGQVNQIKYEKTEYEAVVNADVIELRHRSYKGRQQVRHYNVTKGCWVEKDWIDVPRD